MPAKSEKQRRAFALAMVNPDALYAKNKGLADIPTTTLSDFARKFKGKKRKA